MKFGLDYLEAKFPSVKSGRQCVNLAVVVAGGHWKTPLVGGAG
jgi:cobyrinic acid a,c-diamide synthase